MIYLASILVVILGVTAIFAVRAYARARARAAWEYKQATASFFESARPLLEDDQTPDEIIEAMRLLNATIADGAVSKILVSYPMRGNWNGKSQRLFKVAEEFFHNRPELEDSFKKMFASWFIAVTALAPISGTAARYALTNKDSMQAAAVKASRRETLKRDECSADENGIAHAH